MPVLYMLAVLSAAVMVTAASADSTMQPGSAASTAYRARPGHARTHGWHVSPRGRSINAALTDADKHSKITSRSCQSEQCRKSGSAYLQLKALPKAATDAKVSLLLISYKSWSRMILTITGDEHLLKRSRSWRRQQIRLSGPINRITLRAFGAAQVRTLRLTAVSRKQRPFPQPGAPGQTPRPSSPTTQPLYWGAWVTDTVGNQSPWEMSLQSAFESRVGKAASLINWSSPFYNTSYCGPTDYCDFQTAAFDAIRAHGSIPFFSWTTGPGTGAFSDAAIAAGSQDAYITSWAEAAKTWGHPFFLRFDWEMNGDWFPWGADYPGNTPADYVAMWRHVHDIFTSVGADDVTWVWAPNIDPGNQYTPPAALYPGDAYVDWTGLDGYNGDVPWTSFADLFRSSYDEITSFAPDKPMVIPEIGSTEAGGSKAEWITDMFNSLGQFPLIRALLWFDSTTSGPGDHTDWPVESSPAATTAFAAGISNPLFENNAYGRLDGDGPIAVP